MSAYTGPDEYPIKDIPATPLWSENYAAMFTDSGSDLSVMYSCGRWLADTTLWREIVMVAFPDGRLIYHRGYGRNGDAKGPGGCLSKYDVLEPGKSVRLRFDGPMVQTTVAATLDSAPLLDTPVHRCTIDILFDSATPIWNMKGDTGEAQTVYGAIHIDHIGRSNGTVTWAGEKHTLTDGYSVRDHSRGVRDVRHYGAHNWINGSFPGGRNFYVYTGSAPGSKALAMANAAVEQDGRQYPATVLHTEVIDSTRHAAGLHHIVLASELGEMRIDVTRVRNTFAYSMLVPFDTTPGLVTHRPSGIIYDEYVDMRWNGVEGTGWSERGFARVPLG